MEDYFYIVEKNSFNSKEDNVIFNLEDTKNITFNYFNELEKLNKLNIKDITQSLVIYKFEIINPNLETEEEILNMIDFYKDLDIDVFRYQELFDFELIEQIPVIIEQKYQKNNIVNIETKNNTIKEKIKEKQNIINKTKKNEHNTKINKQNKIL